MRPSLPLCLVACALAACLLLLWAPVAQAQKPCKTDCPPRKPSVPQICGTNGTHRIIFNNLCAMQRHNCVYGMKFRYLRYEKCYGH